MDDPCPTSVVVTDVETPDSSNVGVLGDFDGKRYFGTLPLFLWCAVDYLTVSKRIVQCKNNARIVELRTDRLGALRRSPPKTTWLDDPDALLS